MGKASLRKPGLVLPPKSQEREKRDVPEQAIDQLIGFETPKPSEAEPKIQKELHKGEGSAIEKRIPGKTLKGVRVVVPAEETTLFSGNPRNFEVDHEVLSALRDSIRAVGGNTQAVDARMVNGKVEVIAGSQRRMACIEENVPLVVDLYDDTTDDDAHFIAHVENHARSDISLAAQCRYFSARFQELQSVGDEKIERFAARYKLTYGTMRDYLSFGALPNELMALVADQKLWRFKSLRRLRKVWTQIAEETDLTAPKAAEIALKKGSKGESFKDPQELLKALEGLLPNRMAAEPINREMIQKDAFDVEIKRSPKGFSMNVSVKNKEDLKKIEESIKNMLQEIEV